MSPESILTELKNIQAHAAMTQTWASQLIKKIEGKKAKKERRVNGLTAADRARLSAHAMKSFIK